MKNIIIVYTLILAKNSFVGDLGVGCHGHAYSRRVVCGHGLMS